ncbi:MAG: hypothetical protein H0W08_22195 [Acidobacteria bacterium]|nr:hypothetical protein [Acidobacteriota bacterium]
MPITTGHKGLVSPYTYNEHVFPILNDRCAACHFERGPAQMSVLDYDSVAPWSEAMRLQLLSESMHPDFVDPIDSAVMREPTISPRDLDVLLTWVGGGAPRGEATPPRAIAPTRLRWTSGRPDLIIPMRVPHTVHAGDREEIHEFSLPTGLSETKWVRGLELQPGNRSIVRDAEIRVADGPTLALWNPAQKAMATPMGTAFELSPGAMVRLTIHYKKNYRDDDSALTDRSRVGLYFAQPSRSATIQTLLLSGPATDAATESRVLTGMLAAPVRMLAIRGSLDRDYSSVTAEALTPTGCRSLLVLRSPRADWPRRYWLADPIDLPPGTTIRVTATPLARPSVDALVRPSHRFEVAVEFLGQRQ